MSNESIKGHPAFLAFTAGASKADPAPEQKVAAEAQPENEGEKTAGIFKNLKNNLKNDPEKDADLAAMMAAADKNSPDFDEVKAKKLSDAFNAKYSSKEA